MKELLRHQIDPMAEQPREIVFEFVERETKTRTRGEHVEQVHVAFGPGVAPGLRAEHRQLDEPIADAQLAHARRVDLVPIDHHCASASHRFIVARRQ